MAFSAFSIFRTTAKVTRELPGFQQVYGSFAEITERKELGRHGARTFWAC